MATKEGSEQFSCHAHLGTVGLPLCPFAEVGLKCFLLVRRQNILYHFGWIMSNQFLLFE
jgi:hypothetical protein